MFWRLMKVIMGWSLVKIWQDYVPPPYKESVENNFYGDEPEIQQTVTYAHIVTGSKIESADGS